MHFKFIESISGSIEPSSATTEAAQSEFSSAKKKNNNKQPNKHPAQPRTFFIQSKTLQNYLTTIENEQV